MNKLHVSIVHTKIGNNWIVETNVEELSATKIPELARLRYSQHRRNAKMRGIKWGFTLKSWWKWWIKDNRWLKRGVGRDELVMCRIGDVGAYRPRNVYAGTPTDNLREWQSRKTYLTAQEKEQRKADRRKQGIDERRRKREEEDRIFLAQCEEIRRFCAQEDKTLLSLNVIDCS